MTMANHEREGDDRPTVKPGSEAGDGSGWQLDEASGRIANHALSIMRDEVDDLLGSWLEIPEDDVSDEMRWKVRVKSLESLRDKVGREIESVKEREAMRHLQSLASDHMVADGVVTFKTVAVEFNDDDSIESWDVHTLVEVFEQVDEDAGEDAFGTPVEVDNLALETRMEDEISRDERFAVLHRDLDPYSNPYRCITIGDVNDTATIPPSR